MGQILIIDRDRMDVVIRRFRIEAHPEINVRRHVHQVSRARSQFGQPFCAGERSLRARRRLHGVNIVVTGARMMGVDRQGPLERCHNILCPAFGFTVRRPVVPRLQIHECFGIEPAGRRIVGVPLPQGSHRPGVGYIELGARSVGRNGIPGGERFDVRSFFRTYLPYELQSRPDGLDRLLLLRLIHWEIDIRPQGQGNPPMGHRSLWIMPRSLPERIDRLFVIEGEEQP